MRDAAQWGARCRRFAMSGMANRLAYLVPTVLALHVITAALAPAPSRAAECGAGTVFDEPTGTCVVAPQPPPPRPAPVWNGPRPYVGVSICAPIRFLNICAGI